MNEAGKGVVDTVTRRDSDDAAFRAWKADRVPSHGVKAAFLAGCEQGRRPECNDCGHAQHDAGLCGVVCDHGTSEADWRECECGARARHLRAVPEESPHG